MDTMPIVIEVDGGVADVIFTPEHVGVIILDWDNLKAGDTITQETADTLVELNLYSLEELQPYVEKHP